MVVHMYITEEYKDTKQCVDALIESINKMRGDESLDIHLVCGKSDFQRVMETLLLVVVPKVHSTSDVSDHYYSEEDSDEDSQESIFEDESFPYVRKFCCWHCTNLFYNRAVVLLTSV